MTKASYTVLSLENKDMKWSISFHCYLSFSFYICRIMVTNDIITLPSILLTKTYYILRQEITYTYDKDDKNQNDKELSETGRFLYLKKFILI